MDKPKHQSLKGRSADDQLKNINLNIDSFGRLERNLEIEDLNAFLDDNLEDKKLTDRVNSSSVFEEE